MKLRGSSHIYTVLPAWRNNRDLPEGERIEIDLQGVSQEDMDALELKKAAISADRARDEAARQMVEATKDLVRSKFKGIRGLEIEGVGDITTFDAFYKNAPRELVDWVTSAIFNTFILTEAQAKNFAPPADILSGCQQAAMPGTAPTARSANASSATATTGKGQKKSS